MVDVDVTEPFLDSGQIPKTSPSQTDYEVGPDPDRDPSPGLDWAGDIHLGSTNWRDSTLLKCQIVSSFLVFTLFGLADQAIGAMIPMFQKHYHINDIQVSFIFLSSVLGYFTMGLMNDISHSNLGVRGVVTGGCGLMTSAYLIISYKPPFPLLLICCVMTGLGCGALDASLNTWMGALDDSNQLLGILHGCYGIGCMIAPPLITHLLEKKNNPWTWNQYYTILAICGAFVLTLVSVFFRFDTPAKYKYLNQMKHEANKVQEYEMRSTGDDTETETNDGPEIPDSHEVSMLETIKNKRVIFFALILFIYVGDEVAFGAWMITFLTRIKGMSYKVSSYMATSFWTGLTFGRIVLGFATAHYFKNELTANFTYIAISFVGTLVFWVFAFTKVVPLLFIIVFITGMGVGPIFPTTIVASINVLPSKFQAAGVGFICAFGGGGAAVLPFLVGLVADSSDAGLSAYPLIITVMFGVLLAMWGLVMATHSKNYGNRLR